MQEDHDVSRRAPREDTLSAGDLGILLQWHWKYCMSTFTNERQGVEISLLMPLSAFTGSRLTTPLTDDSSSSSGSQGGSADDLSSNTLANDSGGDTLIGGKSGSKAQTTRPRSICHGDIDLFLYES